MTQPDPFLSQAGRILNSNQARTLILTGNIYDLFRLSTNDTPDYVPIIPFLTANWSLPDLIIVVYELNGPIRFLRDQDNEKVRNAWFKWRVGYDSDELAVRKMLAKKNAVLEMDAVAKTYDDSLRGALRNPTLALELLRQMCLCSRTSVNGEYLLKENLIIIIEGADLVIPDAPITSLSDLDRQRVHICHDWFGDPEFVNANDCVVLLAESRSQLHHRIARLPQLLEVVVPAPNETDRKEFISWFDQQSPPEEKLQLWSSSDDLARLTAGLSLQALMQLLKGARHHKQLLEQQQVVRKVEEFIQSQLGEDIIEFKKPTHTFDDLVGFTRLKAFLKNELMPRFAATGPEALPGAAVCGPIGSGKTFIFEAVAGELDMVVLVLKNIRSQWFGQTDVVFERLRRVLNALAKVLIFVDEADTQLGGVGANTHETERRLTGKIQSMMSDPQMRGRVIWLLVTARIHLLSPDLRRPGRVGDLIIPTLDPEGEDRDAFLKWAVKPVLLEGLSDDQVKQLIAVTRGYSAAGFASLRSELKAKSIREGSTLSFEQVLELISDHIPPAIEQTRRYQTLQALVNCTRRSLLPDPNVTEDQRRQWSAELRSLEALGIR